MFLEQNINFLLRCSEVLLFTIMLGAIFILQRKVARQQQKIIDTAAIISNLEDMLYSNSTLLGSKQTLMRNMLFSKFEAISAFCEQYFESNGSNVDKQRLFLEVKRQVDKLRADDFMVDLQKLINSCENNIIKRISEQVPDIKDIDIKILVYSIVGFRAKAICAFLDISQSNLYTRRSRLIKKIEGADAKDKEEFLHFIYDRF